METGKNTKYFKYAIGEIILVVIGILLALQINNWNENRKTNAENQIILNNLHEEFSENLIELDSSIVNTNSLSRNLEILLKKLREQNNEITQDEFDVLLSKTFVTPNWTPSSFVLEELKNSGSLTKLNNQKLKSLLFKWEREFDRMNISKMGYNEYANYYIQYLSDFGSVRNLDALNSRTKYLKKSIIAKNDISMLQDPKFENKIDNFYFLGLVLIDRYQNLRAIMIEIIKETETTK